MIGFDYARFGEYGAVMRANGVRVDRAAAAGLRPPPRISVAEWAGKHRHFSEDSPYPGKWRHETAPYLVEIMEALSPHDPMEQGDIMKCAQSGGSASGENFVGYVADVAPGPAMYIQATFKAALDWAAEKLWPMIEASPRLNPEQDGAIRAQNAKDGAGSKKDKIVFKRGGYLILAGANSAPSLRQRTVRYAIEDDLDQFPDNLDGQGSPEGMIDNRLKVYRRQGLSKRLGISTPTIEGGSKISRRYKAGDRRRYYLKCPHCGSRFDLVWGDIKWPDGKPEEAYVVAPCCGGVVEHWQKNGMSLTDGWLSAEIDGVASPRHMEEAAFQALRAKMPASRKRGWHITGEITTFQTWADMAVGFVAAQGDLNKLKTWTNLDRGYPFELKGQTPDYELLKELKEQHWGRGEFPYGGLVATMGVDVQGDGLYYEIVLWAENGENWSYGVGFITGATDVPGEGAWADLDKVAMRPIRYPGGKTFPIDQACVDAGYQTAAAEAFCRARPNRLAVFGRAGWTLPVLGRGENIRYERQGENTGRATRKSEDKAYLVGTYGVKLTFYGYLRSTLKAAADERATGVPSQVQGRCHFSRDAPDQWFEQITAETVVVKMVNGYPSRRWEPMPGRQNHWLDCRVYNHAAAEKLMLDTLDEVDWAALKAERYAAASPVQGDLLDLALKAPPQPAPAVVAAAQPVPDRSGWIEATDDWIA